MCKCRRGPICAESNPQYINTPGFNGISVPLTRGPSLVGTNTGIVVTSALNRLLHSKLGSCEFYKILSDLTPGDRERGYFWNYGYKYCNRFGSSSLIKDPKTARWVDCVTLNLQRKILSECEPFSGNINKIKQLAYATHAQVYTDCGICELDKSFIKQIKIALLPDSADVWSSLGRKQIMESLLRCAARSFYFDMIIERYVSWWGNLDEVGLGKMLASMATTDPVNGHKQILGIMEMLSNSFNDDDVAKECMKSLTDDQIDTLSKTSDGRRILFVMKAALESGYTSSDEQNQINRVGDKSRR